MSNDINTSTPAPRVELPTAQPATAVTDKARPEPVQSAPHNPKPEKTPDPRELRRQLQEATEQLNHEMKRNQRDLSFSVDDAADKIVVTVKNTESGEVVRQIPSEAALKVAHNLANVKGLLEDKKI